MSEELIVRHCSPTLAGLKTGNLFRCSFVSEERLREEIRRLNRKLADKGLRILPLRMEKNTALIYVYRPSKLKCDLAKKAAASILNVRGYCCEAPARCVSHLRARLQQEPEFPHEIGLFLGYPPEDVWGFIRKEIPTYSGLWKVYGDAEKARRVFDSYKKCTDVYTRCLEKGSSLERLAVAG
ncbi:MAG: DUF3793 family protein [Clostridia bacterium]|nr:DUF3793 family protein [Clostridia bacterium]